MVDQRYRAIELNVEASRSGRDQRAVAALDALVLVGVVIERVFARGDLLGLGAVRVGDHRAELGVKAAARLEAVGEKNVLVLRGLDALIEAPPGGPVFLLL